MPRRQDGRGDRGQKHLLLAAAYKHGAWANGCHRCNDGMHMISPGDGSLVTANCRYEQQHRAQQPDSSATANRLRAVDSEPTLEGKSGGQRSMVMPSYGRLWLPQSL